MFVTLSIRDVEGLTKDERGDIFYYERYIKCPFSVLPQMLVKDYLYNAFAYLGHQRNNNNIVSTCNLIILDIDHTNKARTEVFNGIIAEGLSVIVSTTSDSNNDYKYRILLPLDREITQKEYRRLVYGLSENGLLQDIDYSASNAGQMIYAYQGSKVLSSFIGLPLSVDDYILPETEVQYITTKMDLSGMEQVFTEFNSYSQAQKGSRTKALLSAGFNLMESGASDKQIEMVLVNINSNMLVPKPLSQLKRRVLNYLKTQRKIK